MCLLSKSCRCVPFCHSFTTIWDIKVKKLETGLQETMQERNNFLYYQTFLNDKWKVVGKSPERWWEGERTTQTSQTTQSSCVPAIRSLPCSPPERGETELCLRGVRKTERKKQWTGECKNREHKKKTSELLPKIKLPLKQKKTQGFIQS